MRARIDKAAFVGIRNLDYEEIHFDPEVLTGLIGPTGAGKSTLAICLCYALLPDRRVLDITPISEVKDSHVGGVDFMNGLINPAYGYSHVVLDITTRLGERMLAGITVTVSAADGMSDFKRWIIKEVPRDIPLQDVMRIVDDGKEYYPDLHELSRQLAKRTEAPLRLHIQKTVTDYGSALYAAGISPTDLVSNSERSLYAKLIEASFKGGLSHEVATKLKEYLLPAARGISDAIAHLQSLTGDVLRTGRTIADADRQITILEAVWNNGRALAVASLQRLNGKLQSHSGDLLKLQEEKQSAEAELQSLAEKPSALEKEIAVLSDTAKARYGAEMIKIQMLDDDISAAQSAVHDRQSEEKDAYSEREQFSSGAKEWKRLAGEHTSRDLEWVSRWYKDEIDKESETLFTLKQQIADKRTEISSLERSNSNQQNEALAHAIGGRSLGEAFKDLGEDEARAMELGLGGLTTGVLGGHPEGLADIKPDGDLPDIFWMGKEAPERAIVQQSGEWYYCARQGGGYTVFSKHRLPVFGHAARAKRSRLLAQEIAGLEDEQKASASRRDKHSEMRDGLVKNEELIRFYLTNKNNETSINDKWFKAKNALDKSQQHLKDKKGERKTLQATIDRIKEPFDEQIALLKSKKADAERRITDLNGTLRTIQGPINETKVKIGQIKQALEVATSALHADYAMLDELAQSTPSESDAVYYSGQQKRLDAIEKILIDESPARIDAFRAAAPDNEVSCICLWPHLKEVLRDRVPSDVLDTNNDSLIEELRKNRSDLGFKLEGHKQEVKIEASNIWNALRSEIRSRHHQIRKLSKIGESLQFGNIAGVRISAQIKNDLLSILEGFSSQVSLFADENKPVQVALNEYFDAQQVMLPEGQDLLDYRTYMDISLDVKRVNKDWEHATSLSGGESIGCGLAIGLMLVRSLAMRTRDVQVREDQITPLFIIDEVHRIDDEGQKTIIEFGKREGFQVLVTAAKLDPEHYPCTLYAIVRDYDPVEQVTIRRVHHLAEAEALDAV